MTQKTMTAKEWRAVLSLALIYAIRMLGLFTLLPVMALYASELSQTTPILVGWAIGVYGLTQAALQIPLGRLSDLWGRKIVISLGLGVFVIGSLCAAFADNIYMIIFGRALQGAGAVAAAVLALVADLTRDSQRSKAMALIGPSIGAAFILALIVGPGLYSVIGGQGLFLLIAAMATFSLLLLWWVVPAAPAVQSQSELTQPLLALVLDRQLLVLNSGIFCLHATLTAVFIAVPMMLLHRYQWAVEWHGWIYLTVMAASLAVMLPALLLAERSGRTNLLLLTSAVLLPAALLGLARPGNSFYLFTVGLAFFFVAFNILEALLPSFVSRYAPRKNRGAALGVYSSFQFIGAFVGGSVGGILVQFWGLQAIFVFGSIIALFWLIIARLFSNDANLFYG